MDKDAYMFWSSVYHKFINFLKMIDNFDWRRNIEQMPATLWAISMLQVTCCYGQNPCVLIKLCQPFENVTHEKTLMFGKKLGIIHHWLQKKSWNCSGKTHKREYYIFGLQHCLHFIDEVPFSCVSLSDGFG